MAGAKSTVPFEKALRVTCDRNQATWFRCPVEVTTDVRAVPQRMHLVHPDAGQTIGPVLDLVEQLDRFAVGDGEYHVAVGGELGDQCLGETCR